MLRLPSSVSATTARLAPRAIPALATLSHQATHFSTGPALSLRQQECGTSSTAQWTGRQPQAKIIQAQKLQYRARTDKTRLDSTPNTIVPQSTANALSSLQSTSFSPQKYISDTQRFVSGLLDVLLQIPRNARKEIFELNYTLKVARLHRQHSPSNFREHTLVRLAGNAAFILQELGKQLGRMGRGLQEFLRPEVQVAMEAPESRKTYKQENPEEKQEPPVEPSGKERVQQKVWDTKRYERSGRIWDTVPSKVWDTEASKIWDTKPATSVPTFGQPNAASSSEAFLPPDLSILPPKFTKEKLSSQRRKYRDWNFLSNFARTVSRRNLEPLRKENTRISNAVVAAVEPALEDLDARSRFWWGDQAVEGGVALLERAAALRDIFLRSKACSESVDLALGNKAWREVDDEFKPSVVNLLGEELVRDIKVEVKVWETVALSPRHNQIVGSTRSSQPTEVVWDTEPIEDWKAQRFSARSSDFTWPTVPVTSDAARLANTGNSQHKNGETTYSSSLAKEEPHEPHSESRHGRKRERLDFEAVHVPSFAEAAPKKQHTMCKKWFYVAGNQRSKTYCNLDLLRYAVDAGSEDIDARLARHVLKVVYSALSRLAKLSQSQRAVELDSLEKTSRSKDPEKKFEHVQEFGTLLHGIYVETRVCHEVVEVALGEKKWTDIDEDFRPYVVELLGKDFVKGVEGLEDVPPPDRRVNLLGGSAATQPAGEQVEKLEGPKEPVEPEESEELEELAQGVRVIELNRSGGGTVYSVETPNGKAKEFRKRARAVRWAAKCNKQIKKDLLKKARYEDPKVSVWEAVPAETAEKVVEGSEQDQVSFFDDAEGLTTEDKTPPEDDHAIKDVEQEDSDYTEWDRTLDLDSKPEISPREFLQRKFFQENPHLIEDLRKKLIEKYPFYKGISNRMVEDLVLAVSYRDAGYAMGSFFEVLVDLEAWPKVMETGLQMEETGWVPEQPYTLFSATDLRHTKGTALTDGIVGYIDHDNKPGNNNKLAGTIHVHGIFEAKSGQYSTLFKADTKKRLAAVKSYEKELEILGTKIFDKRVESELRQSGKLESNSRKKFVKKFVTDNITGGQLVMDVIRMLSEKVIWYRDKPYALETDVSKLQFIILRPKDLDHSTDFDKDIKKFNGRGFVPVTVIEASASRADVESAYMDTLTAAQEWVGSGFVLEQDEERAELTSSTPSEKTPSQAAPETKPNPTAIQSISIDIPKMPKGKSISKKDIKNRLVAALSAIEKLKGLIGSNASLPGDSELTSVEEEDDGELENDMEAEEFQDVAQSVSQNPSVSAQRSSRESPAAIRSFGAIEPRSPRDPHSTSGSKAYNQPISSASRQSFRYPHANIQPASSLPATPSQLTPPSTAASQVAFYETYTYYFGTLQNSWVGGDASCVRIRTGAPAHQPPNGVKSNDSLSSPYFYNERFSVDDLPVDLMHLVGDLLEKKEREEGGTWIVCSMRLVPKRVFSVMLVQSQYRTPLAFY